MGLRPNLALLFPGRRALAASNSTDRGRKRLSDGPFRRQHASHPRVVISIGVIMICLVLLLLGLNTLRAIQSAGLLFSLVPWVLDILIFYLAWKAIRLSRIFPNPARLLVAAVVIFFYNFLMPILLALNSSGTEPSFR
jgi:hypothetical protein